MERLTNAQSHLLNAFKALVVVLVVGLLPPWLFLSSSSADSFLPLVNKAPTTYYVAPGGSDANPGTFNAPWQTPQHAADTALTSSTIYLRAGTYSHFTIQRPGLTFSGYPGESAVIAGDGVEQHTIMLRQTAGVTLRSLTIQDNPLQYGTGIHIENAQDILVSGNLIRANQGFGIVLKDVSRVLVSDNELTDNANAIEVRYGSADVVLRGNRVHHNQRVLDSGRSATGINFYRTTGPVRAEYNWLWENHIGAHLPEAGGAAFEIYAASNVTIHANLIWDNETVLETGTDEQKTPCQHLTFTRNLVWRGARQQGLILRCARDSLVAHNTFDSLDNYVFYLSHYDGEYGASIDGLRIVNNLAAYGRVYAIQPPLPTSVVIDYNLAYNPGSDSEYGAYLAYVAGYGNTNLLSEFQAWTGYEPHGLSSEPRFADYPNADYHLLSGSPAIDRGLVLDETYLGLAPDLGKYEYYPAEVKFLPKPSRLPGSSPGSGLR